MKEIRRRTQGAEQFPSAESALVLVTARLCRIHEQGQERRYLDREPLHEMQSAQAATA